jgi:lysine-specific demethylase 8
MIQSVSIRAVVIDEIRRIARADDATINRVIDSGRPAVFEGIANDWPARSWTLDEIARRGASTSVTVTRTARDRLVLGEAGLVQHRMRLDEFVRERLEQPDGGYVMAPWEELPASLTADVPVPARMARSPLVRRKLWISRTGTVSPLHRDMPQNLLVQLCGEKTVWLAAPGQARNVYPYSLFSGSPNLAHADLERPDLERWPRSARVHALVGRLTPGDGVFIPARWWHQIRTDATSVSVNVWWGEGVSLWIAATAELVKHVRGLSR